MQTITIDYLAGFVDGEGCFSIVKQGNYFKFRISIANTNLELLNIIKENFGGSIYISNKQRKKNHKIAYCLVFYNKMAVELANLLKDKLIIKKQQCEIFSQIQFDDDKRHGISPMFLEQRELAEKLVKELNN